MIPPRLLSALLPVLLLLPIASAAPAADADVRVTKDVAFLAAGRAEKLDVYQRKYAEYVRVSKALQALL